MYKKCVCLISLVFLLGLLGMVDNASALAVRKGPYLIYPGNNTQMTVLWQLDSTSTCTLAWGLDTSYSTGSANTTEYGSDYQHKYTITGLTPGTKYYYLVTAGTIQSMGSFRTAPAADATSVKFLAYGDTRSGAGNHNSVCAGINSAIAADAAYQTMLLHVGDWVAADAEDNWLLEYFNRSYRVAPSADALQTQASLPIQGCMGNHETVTTPGVVYTKYWPYPYVAAHYWSFDYGPVHITVLDQYTPYTVGSDQYNWLVNDLSSSTKPWKFILLHGPGWSAAGGHENNTSVQTYIQPLCVQYGVQIVFGGHNHYYARAVVDGIHHITTGAAGAPFHTPLSGQPYVVVTVASTLEFCKVDIVGDLLVFQAIKASDGTVIDTFSIEYAPDTTPPDPNPMEWSSAPAAIGSTMIAMTATTATDTNGVEYFFHNTTITGHDSGWQAGTTWTDTNLSPNTLYTYQVKARDQSSSHNETAYSTTASETTWIMGDLNGDGIVDLLDFAKFAAHWLETGCSSPDWCGGADLDQPADGTVDFYDLEIFVEHWLDGLIF